LNERDLFVRHPFAHGLSLVQIEKLLPGLRREHYAEGASIFREGAPADALFLIVSGRVGLLQHVPGKGELQLESLTAGDLLGLSWLFPSEGWHLDARATESTEVLAFEAAFVRECMGEDPELGFVLARHIIHQLYQRLERVRLQRLDVYGSKR
jgi:CRP-like cAMP-binding protein